MSVLIHWKPDAIHSCSGILFVSGKEMNLVCAHSCLILLRPHGLHNPWNSPGQNTGVDSLSLLQEIKPMSHTLQVGSLPAEPPEKPRKQSMLPPNKPQKYLEIIILETPVRFLGREDPLEEG